MLKCDLVGILELEEVHQFAELDLLGVDACQLGEDFVASIL